MQSNQLHRQTPLENVSVAYMPGGFIGDQLSPRTMVEKESNEYYVYSKDTMQLPETIRADGGEANVASFNLSTASYILEDHAIKEIVTDRQRENADKPIRLDADTTEFLTGIIKTRREVDLQGVVQTKANWSNNSSLTSTLAWSADTTTSNPIRQIDTAASTILLNCGKKPNVVAMNDQTFDAAKEHVSIIDRIKYTSMQSVTENILANLFNVKTVLKAEATYMNGAEGLTETTARIWNDTVFVGYIDPDMGLKKLTALRTFWKNNTGYPVTVTKWRDNARKGDWIEAEAMFQNKIVASDCGYLIIDTVQ